MEIKRILWPTDMSDEAAEALPYVASLAEKYGAKVIVLHVQENLDRLSHFSESLSLDDVEKLRERFIGSTKTLFQKLCDKLGEKCADYEKRVETGDAAVKILETVDKEKIDLVVMATHGYGGIKRFAYGSVANKVMQHSNAPVLAIRLKR